MRNRFIRKTLSSGLFTISSTEAKFILDNYNKINRPLKNPLREKYSAAMAAKEWYTAVSIIFDYNGNLIDGQNRLASCVSTGVEFQTFVNMGVNPAAQKALDRHGKRSLNDAWTLTGGAKTKAATTQIATNWYRSENNWKSQGQIPDFKIEDCYNINIIDILAIASRSSHQQGFGRVGFLTACAQYHKRDSEKAVEFYDKVVGDGSGFDAGNPALAMRNFLLATNGGGGKQITDDYESALTAIHKFHRGLTVKKLNRKTKTWEF